MKKERVVYPWQRAAKEEYLSSLSREELRRYYDRKEFKESVLVGAMIVVLGLTVMAVLSYATDAQASSWHDYTVLNLARPSCVDRGLGVPLNVAERSSYTLVTCSDGLVVLPVGGGGGSASRS